LHFSRAISPLLRAETGGGACGVFGLLFGATCSAIATVSGWRHSWARGLVATALCAVVM
jgi:hypothetical protein